MAIYYGLQQIKQVSILGSKISTSIDLGFERKCNIKYKDYIFQNQSFG